MNNPRIAIVHDWFVSMGGAERVVNRMLDMYPQADIYALFGSKDRLHGAIKEKDVRYSFLNKIPFIKSLKLYRYMYFLFPFFVEKFDLSEYDIVISSSHCVAHGVITGPDTKHISYIYSPMRYAWDLRGEYFNRQNFSLWKRLVIPPFLHFLRIWDVNAFKRADKVIAISNFVKQRIERYYGRDVDEVIYPPVKLSKGLNAGKRSDYYITISPCEPNKGGDLIVDVAINLGINVKILGEGSTRKRLMKKARGYENVQFLGWVSEEEKWELLSRAKAMLFFGVEDFGNTVVEALSCGTPIIAYAKGGALETVEGEKTGVFFSEVSVKSASEAIKKLDYLKIDREYLRKSAMEFEPKVFRSKFKAVLA